MVDSIKELDYDFLILLGDLGYDLHFDQGKKGDKYFEMIQPLTEKTPVFLVNGNHDMAVLGNILNFRYRMPGAVKKEDNN